jgi:hypothetical protein
VIDGGRWEKAVFLAGLGDRASREDKRTSRQALPNSQKLRKSNMTARLQGIGNVNSKAAGDFKAGETMLWNYGLEELVVAVEKETAKTITFTIKNTDGQRCKRHVRRHHHHV